mgnify:CR=1 FL=1
MITIFKDKQDIPQNMEYIELNDLFFNIEIIINFCVRIIQMSQEMLDLRRFLALVMLGDNNSGK